MSRRWFVFENFLEKIVLFVFFLIGFCFLAHEKGIVLSLIYFLFGISYLLNIYTTALFCDLIFYRSSRSWGGVKKLALFFSCSCIFSFVVVRFFLDGNASVLLFWSAFVGGCISVVFKILSFFDR